MKRLFLFAWLMMLSIVAMAQNEKVGNDLVIKNGAGTVVERVSATENTEMKFDAKGKKLSIKKDGGTKDISLDEVKTISAVPAFRLVAQDKFVYTSTSPITLHFKLTVNDQGEMKPASGESVTFTANKGTLAPITATTNDNGVATVVYTPKAYLWEPGFSDIIQGLYTYTDNGGNVSRYTARTYVEYNGDYTIECLSPDQKLGPHEEAEAIFAVYEVSPSGKKPYIGATIEFSAPEGFISTQSPTTDAFGMARVTFHNDGDDAKEYPVTARFLVDNDNGRLYTGTATAKFITLNYQLEALTPKLAVRNDGSEQDCFFTLYEYHNGKWNVSEKEAEAKFEATGVTLTKTSDMNRGYGFIANFTAGKSFSQGSVTAKCDIELQSGKVWQGVATTELVADDYQFTRVFPVGGNPADISPEESEDVMFLLTKLVNGQYQSCPGKEVRFECQEGGTLSSTLVKTDANGHATTSFQLNKDEDHATVYVNCSFADEHGIWHVYEEDVDFELTPYKLEAVNEQVAVRKDESDQKCYFKLYVYENGQWNDYKEEEVVNFKATGTGVTLTQTYDKNDADGVTAIFSTSQGFNGGSVTATCDIQLDNGRVWHGVASTALVLDDYMFLRVSPIDDINDIHPEQSRDVEFTLVKIVDGLMEPCQGKDVWFTSSNGTLTNKYVTTNAEGSATTTFKMDKGNDHATINAHCMFIDEQGILHEYSEDTQFYLHDYKLTCLTPEVKMKSSDKKVTVRFELQEYKDGQWKARPNVEVSISAKRGTVDPVNPTTNESGVCETQFTPSEDALNSVVTAKFLFGVGSEYYTVSDTARITIEDKMVLDDPKLIKAYNLKDNTVAFDGDELPITFKEGFYEKYVYTGWNEYPEDYEHPKGRFQVNWIALKNYLSEKVVNDVWKKNRIYMRGQADDIPEVILSLEDEGHQSNWVPGSNRDYDKENDLLYSNVAYVEWEADADKFEKYAQRWREQQEGYDPRAEGWKYQYPELPEPPEDLFAKWTYEVKSVKAAPSNDFGWGTKYMKHIGYTNRGFTYYPWNPNDSPNGKDFFFEEANQFVYIAYRIMPNGDDAYVKVVFPKDSSEFQYKEIKY